MIEIMFDKISEEIKQWIRTRKSMIQTIGKIFIVIILTSICAFPHSTWQIIWKVLSYKNLFILRFANFYFWVFYVYPVLRKTKEKEMKVQKLYWVELDKITEYILSFGKFPRDEVVKYFGISRQTAQNIIDKLDEVQIFIRGNNNQRMVDINLTGEDMIRLLTFPTPILEEKNKDEEIENCDNEAVQTQWQDPDENSANYSDFIRKPLAN